VRKERASRAYTCEDLLQSALGNVLAVLHALELDGLHTLVGTSDSIFQSRTSGSGSDDATAACYKLTVLDIGTCVEDDGVFGSGSQGHGSALGVRARVATSSDDDSSSGA
jgi:hypothetical protein